MTRSGRLRIVLLCGEVPADSAHLARLAEEVDLCVYRSSWQRPWLPPGGVVRHPVRVRSFAPVVRSRRGTLALAFRGLRKALEEDRPDVVHVISEPWGLLAAQAAAWRRRDPSTRRVAMHGCDTLWHHGSRPKQAARRSLLRFTLPSVDGWAAESHKALEVATDNGLPANTRRARIHTNPRDTKTFRPPTAEERSRARIEHGLPEDAAVVGLIARLVPEKGVQPFIDAARTLLAEGFTGCFVIAGDGPLAAVARAAQCDGVRFVGPLSHPQGVSALLHALDVIACPSTTTARWEDQGPRIVLEGMLSGCVPAGSPTGAIPEMLGGLGAIADSTSPSDLSMAIIRATELAADPDRRSEVVAYANSRFSSEAVAGQLMQLWSAIAAQPGRGVAG